MKFKSIVAVAGKTDLNGDVLSCDLLRDIAGEFGHYEFDENIKSLVYTGNSDEIPMISVPANLDALTR